MTSSSAMITVSTGSSITINNAMYVTGSVSGTTTATTGWYNTSTSTGITMADLVKGDTQYLDGDIEVQPHSSLKLPDGSVVDVDGHGNFTISDKDAIVTYKGNNVREFNQFINASDLLEAFIGDLGDLGVKQDQVLNVPIETFINWLIFKAAEQDGDDVPPDVPLLESSVTPHKHPKCLCCGKFIKKALVEHKIHFCSPEHHGLYLERIGI
jgi:hypothetical protein